LAEAWQCRPGEIDEVRDADEIGTYLEILELKQKYEKNHNRDDDSGLYGPNGEPL
jgi:hypothetical protein